MTPELIARYDRRVPRYTSYPTAPHLHPGIGAATYGDWLERLPADATLSLYVHVPFCDSLCWFCGCHTKIVRRYEPIAAYLELLNREIEVVVRRTGRGRPLLHVHFGGGSPTILEADDIKALGGRLRDLFELCPGVEIAVEIDPRGLDRARVEALAGIGVNRASLGVQDVNPEVQRAINRHQPIETTARVVDWLREAGIDLINVDLMYGLPRQTVDGVQRSVSAALDLGPDRTALFGYAHVPWMKRHQRLIDETALPAPVERWAQYQAASAMLEDAGYRPIGLDHFARPDDALTIAQRERRLRRNFQGYTADTADALIGLGPSAIGALAQGYVQNAVPIHAWREAIGNGRLAVAKGIALTDEDRLRREVIERLMCDLEVEIGATCARHNASPGHFEAELEALRDLAADGLAVVEGSLVRVPDEARPLVRVVASTFDRYLNVGAVRHARAV